MGTATRAWGSRARLWWVTGGAVLVLVTAAVAAYLLTTPAPKDMTARAAEVMPFDLAATHHSFTATEAGGVELVITKNPDDQANIGSIRAHLRHEADRFTLGDYSDPARIHGADMPGLAELRAGAGRVQVRYAEVTSGAQLTFTSTDPALIQALHRWFDAQNHDHAKPGMGMDH